MSLFGELRRRNVFRVAIAYLVAAWLIAQVAELALDSFGSPPWVMKTLLLMLAIGLPIAVIFAWAFELTPDGVVREKDVDRTASITDKTGKKLNRVIIGVLAAALMVSVATHRWTPFSGTTAVESAGIEATTGDESIAVLPFINMSDDPNNEFFSDGISEELLNVLVRVEGLRVASRTSSFAFKNKGESIPNIAKSLGVDHVLEGSVRKSGDTVRITAQLIDARTDTHLWSETYDRKLEDIFAIQDEISGHIVAALKEALGASFSGEETLAEQPTENLDAYQDYLRGRYFWQRRGAENILKAIKLFEKATTADPAFARAWSSLAAAHITMPAYSDEPASEHYPNAERYAKKALALDGTIAEAHAVLAELARDAWRWSEAEVHYLNAIKNEPKNATSYLWYSEHLLSTGRIDEAMTNCLIALRLDPLHPGTHSVMGAIYGAHGDRENAVEHSRTAWELGHVGSQLEVMKDLLNQQRFDEAMVIAESFEAQSFDTGKGVVPNIVAAYRDESLRQNVVQNTILETPISIRSYFLTDLVHLGFMDEAFGLAATPKQFRLNSLFQLWRHDMSAFRSDPRFADLIDALGFESYWDKYGWPPACQRDGSGIVCR
jgi:TolB-like protein/Tfp pilus assembly protein PilF